MKFGCFCGFSWFLLQTLFYLCFLAKGSPGSDKPGEGWKSQPPGQRESKRQEMGEVGQKVCKRCTS